MESSGRNGKAINPSDVRTEISSSLICQKRRSWRRKPYFNPNEHNARRRRRRRNDSFSFAFFSRFVPVYTNL